MGKGRAFLLVVQIIAIIGPILLIVYYTGQIEKTVMGTCTLQSVQINGSTIPMGGAFTTGEEAISGCFLNRVHVLTINSRNNTVVTAHPINHNSTDPFPCFYSSVHIDGRGWRRPEDKDKDPNDVECLTEQVSRDTRRDSTIKNDRYNTECLGLGTDIFYASTANDAYCKGAKLKEQYYKAYFNDARQVFVSLHSEETWSEDRAYAEIGWIGTGLLLLEIVVGLYCFGYKKTKKVTRVYTY